jgi:transposase-like protein
MICTIGGERVCFWRAVDDEGETPDLVVRKRRNSGAALKLLKRLLRT